MPVIPAPAEESARTPQLERMIAAVDTCERYEIINHDCEPAAALAERARESSDPAATTRECISFLREAQWQRRLAGATCLYARGETSTSHVATMLDAYLQETDDDVQTWLAMAIGSADGEASGQGERIRAIIAAAPLDGRHPHMLAALFGGSGSRAANATPATVELAFSLLQHDGAFAQHGAIQELRRLPDQAGRLCAALAEIMRRAAQQDTVHAMRSLGPTACHPVLPIIAEATVRMLDLSSSYPSWIEEIAEMLVELEATSKMREGVISALQRHRAHGDYLHAAIDAAIARLRE